MFKKHPGFNFIFFLIFAVQLMSQSDTLTDMFLFPGAKFISKPLITLSLLIWLLYHTGYKGRYSKSIALGLLAGLCGDVFLMFTDRYPDFFLAGLISFLIGHIFYIDYKLNKSVHPGHRKNAIIAYSFFVIIFMFLLIPNLKISLISPVLLYAITISLMGIVAVCRFGRVNAASYKMVVGGAILFVISDAILAYNKFVNAIPFAGFFIMFTYMIAQYLITYGNIERKIKRRVEDI
jgi:uncharacterized membrane protein YhhN